MTITPIPTVNPQPYTDVLANITRMDMMGTIIASTGPYTVSVGNLFYLFIWLMVFSMYWLAQKNITLPAVMGIILGGVVISTLPESYQPVAVALIALGGFAVIYYLYTERR